MHYVHNSVAGTIMTIVFFAVTCLFTLRHELFTVVLGICECGIQRTKIIVQITVAKDVIFQAVCIEFQSYCHKNGVSEK